MTRPLRLALAALLPALAACAAAPRAEPDAAPADTPSRAQPHAPLAALAGARVVVLPTRYLSVDPEVRWRAAAADSAAALAGLDAALREALRARGVGADWVWPDAVRRSVARSAGRVSDPAGWDAAPLLKARAGVALGLPQALHSPLRALGALHDARYVLYPLEYTVAPERAPSAAGAQPRGALRLALIDVRAARVNWIGTVEGAPAAGQSAAVPAGVASRVADLVAPAR